MSPSTNRRASNRQGRNTNQTTEFLGEELPRESEQENSVEYFHLHHAAAAALQNSSLTPSPHFIRIRGQTISRLELKTARHAVYNASLFFMFSLPTCVTLLFASSVDCPSSDYIIRHQECLAYLWFLAYARGLMVLYIIFNPTLFCMPSPDLSRALNRRGL